MGKRRNKKPPKFEGSVKQWAMAFMRKNYWRIAAMYDREDLEQEAFTIYWSVQFNHPTLTDKVEFMRLFKARMRGMMKTRSAACFPNPYNFGQDSGCISLTSDTGGDLTEVFVSSVCISAGDLEVCLDLASRLPSELREVFMALVREAIGIEAVPFRWRRRLTGRATPETLNGSLARRFNLSSDRDLFAEVSAAINKIQKED